MAAQQENESTVVVAGRSKDQREKGEDRNGRAVKRKELNEDK